MAAELTTTDGHDEFDVLALESGTVAQVPVLVVFAIADKPIPDVGAVIPIRPQVSNFEQTGGKQLN